MRRCSGATSLIRKEYFLSKETAIIMAVLSLLALFAGVGGTGLAHFYDETLFCLVIWFWILVYPLMPALKGWYISVVHRIYLACQVDVMMVSWPFPSICQPGIGKPVILRGFQVPAVGLIFLLHIPYWLAISYGLTCGLSELIRRYDEAVQKALQRTRARG